MTGIPEAALAPEEKQAIHEPLERMIKRMSPNASKRFQSVADPIAVIVGLSFWGIRVTQLVQMKRQEAEKQANADTVNQSTAYHPAADSFSYSPNGANGHSTEAGVYPSDPT